MRFVLYVVGVVVLAVALSAAWLFRADLVRRLPPQVARVGQALGAGAAPASGDVERTEDGRAAVPGPAALGRARDKVDSLHGWHADSVVLSAPEVASLIVEGLPPAARARLDSIRVRLGDDRITVTARLETRSIPKSALGPLAGALAPWEAVTGSGLVAPREAGWAEWRVDALTLRGFTLPAPASRDLLSRALPGVRDGALPFALPRGISRIRVRPAGATLYREAR
ncbi:MAG: hypothetical protein IPK12_10790 [Gemmatimonadetes bacterium]|nr:hypothetical protein [Gemmatimonadota bacterium]